jgi:hypothetical protein
LKGIFELTLADEAEQKDVSEKWNGRGVQHVRPMVVRWLVGEQNDKKAQMKKERASRRERRSAEVGKVATMKSCPFLFRLLFFSSFSLPFNSS